MSPSASGSKVNFLSLERRIPKPSYRHAAPAGFVVHYALDCTVSNLNDRFRPWPYIDSLADQESEEVIDAKMPNIIGSCGHNNCEDCKIWVGYPQSLFGNWTAKPVRKCGIEQAVKNRDHASTIYTVDVMEDGVFRDSGEFEVTNKNKRKYWRDTLMSEVSSGVAMPPGSNPFGISVRAESAYVLCSLTRYQDPSCKCLAPCAFSFDHCRECTYPFIIDPTGII